MASRRKAVEHAWLHMSSWSGRLAYPVEVLSRGRKFCRVRLLHKTHIGRTWYPRGTIKHRVPNESVVSVPSSTAEANRHGTQSGAARNASSDATQRLEHEADRAFLEHLKSNRERLLKHIHSYPLEIEMESPRYRRLVIGSARDLDDAIARYEAKVAAQFPFPEKFAERVNEKLGASSDATERMMGCEHEWQPKRGAVPQEQCLLCGQWRISPDYPID